MGGPALVLVLEKTGAVGDWRSAIGPLEGADKQAPESLRAMYAGKLKMENNEILK